MVRLIRRGAALLGHFLDLKRPGKSPDSSMAMAAREKPDCNIIFPVPENGTQKTPGITGARTARRGIGSKAARRVPL
jgi:hypothetical protein